MNVPTSTVNHAEQDLMLTPPNLEKRSSGMLLEVMVDTKGFIHLPWDSKSSEANLESNLKDSASSKVEKYTPNPNPTKSPQVVKLKHTTDSSNGLTANKTTVKNSSCEHKPSDEPKGPKAKRVKRVSVTLLPRMLRRPEFFRVNGQKWMQVNRRVRSNDPLLKLIADEMEKDSKGFGSPRTLLYFFSTVGFGIELGEQS
ncbi:hypothetical protein RUND412_002329 [Rhizina undulata]